MGVVVDVDKREGSETTNAAASGRSQTLAEMVSILRQQLGLSGNMREVVEQAAQQLGTRALEPGSSLVDVATDAIAALGA